MAVTHELDHTHHEVVTRYEAQVQLVEHQHHALDAQHECGPHCSHTSTEAFLEAQSILNDIIGGDNAKHHFETSQSDHDHDNHIDCLCHSSNEAARVVEEIIENHSTYEHRTTCTGADCSCHTEQEALAEASLLLADILQENTIDNVRSFAADEFTEPVTTAISEMASSRIVDELITESKHPSHDLQLDQIIREEELQRALQLLQHSPAESLADVSPEKRTTRIAVQSEISKNNQSMSSEYAADFAQKAVSITKEVNPSSSEESLVVLQDSKVLDDMDMHHHEELVVETVLATETMPDFADDSFMTRLGRVDAIADEHNTVATVVGEYEDQPVLSEDSVAELTIKYGEESVPAEVEVPEEHSRELIGAMQPEMYTTIATMTDTEVQTIADTIADSIEGLIMSPIDTYAMPLELGLLDDEIRLQYVPVLEKLLIRAGHTEEQASSLLERYTLLSSQKQAMLIATILSELQRNAIRYGDAKLADYTIPASTTRYLDVAKFLAALLLAKLQKVPSV